MFLKKDECSYFSGKVCSHRKQISYVPKQTQIFTYFLQTPHVYSTLKRCGNDRFRVVSTQNTRGVFLGFRKQQIIQYRNYKTFNEQLWSINAELEEIHYEFLSVLNKHVPVKYKHIRANNSSYMTKSLRKKIMLRSRLRNKFLKTKPEKSKQLYYKQRNLCVSLLRKPRRNHFLIQINPLVSENAY